MKKLLLTFGFLLITIITFAQETKFVNTEQLNVRSGAGTKYEIVEKISLGQTVIVLSNQGKWCEIELENGTKGFVSTKFLSDNTTSNNSSNSNGKSQLGGYLVLIGLILYGYYKVKKFFRSHGSSLSSNFKPRERGAEKQQPKPQVIHICKYCGYEDKNLKSLTFFTCHRSPTNKHQPLEGGIQEIYSCKHCGYQNKNLSTLTFFTCQRSPTGKHQPHI